MKLFLRLLPIFLISVLFSMSIAYAVDISHEQAGDLAKPVIEAILGFLPPSISLVFIVIGALRFVFKPFMTALGAFVKETPSLKDDALYEKVAKGNTYKFLIWLLDYVASIKVRK